ncbi:hypothetical protein AMBAS45_16435 [Alteromonas macleodii str. 'Balearic Sea AD45']|uniref:hypothetical protein n=1 Tax=Alteromonas macleodii TaxID=28108 RepID=UPI000286FE8E|nr:hypothetical protein [Alteromonas macleodii]AFT96748.1 hypothetical protein AMBAS45_16435 [Alteromonas macleodii str. 'Balearic Sea AD45']
MTKAPTPEAAIYNSGYSRTTHVADLVKEERFNEAFSVILDQEIVRIKMDRETSVALDKFLLTPEGSLKIDKLVRKLSSENLTDRVKWRGVSEDIASVQVLIQTFGTGWNSDWKTRLERSVEDILENAKKTLVNNVAKCSIDELVDCVKEYPVNLWKLNDGEPYESVREIVNRKSTAAGSLNAFIEKVSIFKGLKNNFLKSNDVYADVYWLNNRSDKFARSVPRLETMVLQNKIVDDIPDSVDDVLILGLPIQDVATIVDKKRLEVVSNYTSGEVNQINPRHDQIRIEIQSLKDEIDYQNSVVSSANLSGGQSAFMRGTLIAMQSELRNLYNSLSKTPRYVKESVFSPYNYYQEVFSVKRKTSWSFFFIDMEQDLIWENLVENESIQTFKLNYGVHSSDKSAKNSDLDIEKLINEIYKKPPSLRLDRLIDPTSYNVVDLSSNGKIIDKLSSVFRKREIKYLESNDFEFVIQFANTESLQPSFGTNISSSRAGYAANKPATGEYFISRVSNGGGIISLSDGSIWQVNTIDKIDSMLWLPTSTVIVINDSYGYSMVNLDDGTNVRVEYLGNK